MTIEDCSSYINVSESAQDRDVGLGEADSETSPKKVYEESFSRHVSATPVDETNQSEGNNGTNTEVPIFQKKFENQNEGVSLRRSSRVSKLPVKLNDYVLSNKARYGLNRFVNHSMLSVENYVFVSNLNKSYEPSSYKEASKDINWIDAMNNEILALYENDTWELVELPFGRKPIGSKWVFKIKYMSSGEIKSNSESEIEKFKSFLNKKFKIKDLGELKYFLGIEVLKTKLGLCLNQIKYCLELLHEFGLLACRPVLTPLPKNIVLAHKETNDDKFLLNITNYQNLVGKLIYLCMTRPDISYGVHCLSQHMHAPLQSHFNLALRLLRYLKLAPGSGIDISKSKVSFKVVAYSDSDRAKCPMTRKSVSGYWVFFNGSLVSWKSKKQATLSKSSEEVEYRAMASATYKIIWIIKILKDVDVHIVRENVASRLIETMKVDPKCQVADILTKALETVNMVL
nr:ribonuclease H-like domain-containing protein [Tanacetum cinerariifolium]